MAYRNALLRNTRLYESLVKSIPENFEELIQKTDKYARLEEEKKSTTRDLLFCDIRLLSPNLPFPSTYELPTSVIPGQTPPRFS